MKKLKKHYKLPSNKIYFHSQDKIQKNLILQDCEYLIEEIRENGAGEDFFNALKYNK